MPAEAYAPPPAPCDAARAARIARLAQAVQSGTYRADAHAIAGALLRAMDTAAGVAQDPPPPA